MKNFNWLIKLLFYKHKEHEAVLPKGATGIFYKVGFVDQQHANLCTNASESMLNHFWGKPFATMTKNPRDFSEGASPNNKDYYQHLISPNNIQTTLQNKGPFILSLPLKYGVSHSVVVTGCTQNQIIYNDPLTGGHKMISTDELKKLCMTDGGQVEIATLKSVNQSSLANKVQNTLPNPPINILPATYQRFFSLDKMEDPRQAVLSFLNDYAKFSLWGLGRHHKQEVRALVERNKDQPLNQILLDLHKTFPTATINSKGELLKRLLIIEKILNIQPTVEIKKDEKPPLQP